MMDGSGKIFRKKNDKNGYKQLYIISRLNELTINIFIIA